MGEGFVASVRGPSSVFPRGFTWLILAWYAIIALVLVVALRKTDPHLPDWYYRVALAALAVVALTLAGALRGVRHAAFRATADGIWLGIPTTRRRPRRRFTPVPWIDVAQLRVFPRYYGVLIELVLNSPRARRHRDRVPAALALGTLRWLGALIFVGAVGRGWPGLTGRRSHPPRYVIPLADLQSDDLIAGLATLVPPFVRITVWRGRRGSLPPGLDRLYAARARHAARPADHAGGDLPASADRAAPTP